MVVESLGRISPRNFGFEAKIVTRQMLELLLRAGSNINAQNIVGDAPLHKAALNGRALSADYLIRAGANVNIRNEFAQTPLHAACVSGNIDVVQRLVQGGADTGAQDAAEDTPFHEACRHQYEGIVVYLMGLVNNPETSQGLKLWEGLDPSWEKMLRSRAQARVEDGTEEDVGKPQEMSTAAAAAGLSSVRLGVTTPSTTRNSLRSSESAMGLGVSNRTPARRDVFSTSGSRDRGGGGGDTAAPTRERKMMMPPRGETASTKGSTKERKIMSAPSAAQVQPGVHHQRTTARNRGSDSAAPAAGTAMSSSDGARVDGTRSGSRPSSATRRRRRSREGDAPPGETSPRVFSNGAADVLAWQATKVKSAKQGRLIEKAREALRETEHEAEMARSRSMTSLGDDEGSIDTCNTADSPTTVGSRSSRRGERRQRRAISPAAKPAETLEVSDLDADGNPQSRRVNANASAAADLSDAESQPSRGSRRVKPVATNGTGGAAAGAAAAAEAAADDARGRAVSPVMPTPPRAEGRDDVNGHAPPRESGRRQSARLAKGQVVSVRSPVARVSRRPSGFSKADDVDGRGRRSSRRGSSSRSAAAATSSSAAGSGEGGGDAGGPRRSSGGSCSSRGPGDHGQSPNKHGGGESRSATAAAARPRRSKKEGVRAENGEGGGGRSPSARRERHRKRGEDATGVGGRSSPSGGGGGGSSRRKSRSSRGEGGESSSRKSVGGSGSSSRRRDTKATTSSSSSRRSQREGSDGHATTAAPTTQAPAPAPASSSPAHSRATAGAFPATSVPKASHESRSHSGNRASSSRAKEGTGTSSRTKEGRERRTPAASSPGGRLYATAPRQRQSSPDLCPPTWASNVPSSTLEDASRKRVVASDFPARRVVSPYNSRKREPPAGGRRTRSSASPTRSSSPRRRSALPPPASRPVEKEIDPQGEGAEREVVVNGSSHASSFPTETAGDDESLPEAATAAAEAKPAGTFNSSAVPGAASARSTWEAKPTAAANGVATAAAVGDGVVQASPARSSAAGAESEGPPLIDALLMEKKKATDGDSTAARAEKEEGLREEREDRAACTASTKSNPRRSFTAIETSKSIVFSDSDSDSEVDNDGSKRGSNGSPNESPTSGGDVRPMAALSAVSTVFARQRSDDKKGETVVLGNKQADSSVSSAVSAEVLDSDSKADDPAASVSRSEEEEAGSGDEGGTATTASKEDRQGLPSYQDALAAGAAAAAAVHRPAGPDMGPEAVYDGAAAPAEGEGRGTVEPSPAPQNYLRPLPSSTLPSTMAVLAGGSGGGGGGGGRPRSSALGRPGMPSAKGESEESAAAADGDGEREEKEGVEASSGEGDAGVGASGSKAGNAVAAASGNHAATLAAKGPRGFTNPAQSQEGPNKGPAGAFSGNSMWRLAGGTAAGAGRARSGVAANGHGGYSNPLAAMRAAGSGGGAETSSGGGGAGGGVANPLAGLRGAASMGGAGVSNPLARGRGVRAGGSIAGGMANPMLRSGGGDMGGLARGIGGGVPSFSSSVGTTGRTAPPPPPPRDDEGSLSPGPATMPPLSSSPTEMGRAPAIPAAMSWGPSPSSADTTAAAAGDDGDATEAAASTGGGGGEGNAAMRRGGGSERPPTEFRAIGSNGSWPTDGALVPPRRRAASRGAQPHSMTERDPGQEKVGGLVKALQQPDASGLRLLLHNRHNPDLSASGSSLSNLGEKGLVKLRRAKYSPRPAAPGLLDPKETEVDADA
ncbi:ankyrin domain protein [Ectocarpus siliculosus]|uniref:Ankyrin domain protein n=1 Tax=Ectocarpus siliculosus TaxID=2880 RepID=D8LC53_ECTSI|nr:ankyrin domain protein [Ectocarpus siliculosus]|eukprot:CBN79236.1 ankyrin domain protein [Ectocarpus siliculosus]